MDASLLKRTLSMAPFSVCINRIWLYIIDCVNKSTDLGG